MPSARIILNCNSQFPNSKAICFKCIFSNSRLRQYILHISKRNAHLWIVGDTAEMGKVQKHISYDLIEYCTDKQNQMFAEKCPKRGDGGHRVWFVTFWRVFLGTRSPSIWTVESIFMIHQCWVFIHHDQQLDTLNYI